MLEWIIVIICFVGVAISRTYLFKKSYQKKLKYYTHPYTLAKEVIEEKKRLHTTIEFQNQINIEKVSEMVGYNLGCVVRFIDQENPNFEQIAERLRNISIYINMIKIVYEKNTITLTEQLKILGSIIGPVSYFYISFVNRRQSQTEVRLMNLNFYFSFQIQQHLDAFTKIRKFVEEENKDEKKKKKRDKYLDKSVDNYIQHIVEDLSGYMFGF